MLFMNRAWEGNPGPNASQPRMVLKAAHHSSPRALVLLAGMLVACSSAEGKAPSDDAGPPSGPAASVALGAASAAASVVADLPAVPVPAPMMQLAALPDEDLYPATLEEQREALFRRMAVMLHLTDEQMAAVRAVFKRSKVMGQGNPATTKYPNTRKECREKRNELGGVEADSPVCDSPFMAPIWDPLAGETENDAKVCIDRFEFPGIPCEHPLVYESAREAAELCAAIGKRLCDAHEWEGACAGAVHAPEEEYLFGKPRRESKEAHNRDREIVWAYGHNKDHSKCGTKSKKNEGCTSSGWKRCGSNTFPAGFFPECKSPFGVYDQHGNTAEHMNLPVKPEELTSHGGAGVTEMKGSWFIFSTFEAHPDDCRWRAPDWHGTKVMDYNSHANYHLGFRCCKSVEVKAPPAPAP